MKNKPLWHFIIVVMITIIVELLFIFIFNNSNDNQSKIISLDNQTENSFMGFSKNNNINGF
jgi:hypothetical protein